MFVLFTDFGLNGPYIGQVKAVLHERASTHPIVDLFADAPRFDPRASAYLLAGYTDVLPAQSIVVAVVDPGVGSARETLLLRADRRWFVGPDNGLMAIVARRARSAAAHRIDWEPARLSASFHGRDLFAPVAAELANGARPLGAPVALEDLIGHDWPSDWAAVIYIDVYGNVMTGLRAKNIEPTAVLEVGGHRLNPARTFSDVPVGEAFWYENSNGLVEIAVNQGRADQMLGLAIGDRVRLLPDGS